MPGEHSTPTECCGSGLPVHGVEAGQVAEHEENVSRRNVRMRDMECSGCGAIACAPRRGTVKGARLGPRMLAAF